MFIISKNKYLSNDMKIFGTCSIPLNSEKIREFFIADNFINDIAFGLPYLFCGI